MADELMTTRELQEFLRVDRTTIYNMLNEGRLHGFKVGGQWRFSRQEIENWLREQRTEAAEPAVRPSSNALPLNSIQSIQAIFAEAMGVGAIVTRLDGEPLTPISNSCAFCNLILSTPKGYQRCVNSWQALAGQKERSPQLRQCHAGLLYARGRIEVEDEFVAMTFAGQVVLNRDMEQVTARLNNLAMTCEIDPAQLHETLGSVRALTAGRANQLMNLLGRLGETLSDIGRERLVLLRKLRHIADVTII